MGGSIDIRNGGDFVGNKLVRTGRAPVDGWQQSR
jgi:hypothetical protein